MVLSDFEMWTGLCPAHGSFFGHRFFDGGRHAILVSERGR